VRPAPAFFAAAPERERDGEVFLLFFLAEARVLELRRPAPIESIFIIISLCLLAAQPVPQFPEFQTEEFFIAESRETVSQKVSWSVSQIRFCKIWHR